MLGYYLVLKTWALVLIFLLSVSLSDGSDGTWHHKHQKHHNNHHRHHTRQRRQEWSPSQAIHEKRNEGSQGSSVRSEITFGHETQVAEEWVFLTRNATTVKAHIGSTAILPCEVKKESQFGMITWSRLEDKYRPYSLLTIGDQNYVEDKRIFVARPPRGLTNLAWSLRIQRVTPDDAGRYECQATTHPPQSIVTRLKVVEAVAQILGTAEKIIKSGSTLQLHCILKRATEEPLYVFWYHNDRMINYDKERGIKVTKDSSGSTLTLNSAHSQDSGNYTCSPYNIRAASVLVHVLSEGNSAAAVQNEQDKDSKMSQNKKAQKAASSAVTERTPPSAAVHSAANADRVIVIPSLLLSAILLMLHSATMTVFLSETRRSS